MTDRKRKPTKPKPLWPDSNVMMYIDYHQYRSLEYAFISGGFWLTAKQCRKLSAWLEKAATYLESQEANK